MLTCDENKSCKIYATLVEIIAEKFFLTQSCSCLRCRRVTYFTTGLAPVLLYPLEQIIERLRFEWLVILASKQYREVSNKNNSEAREAQK